jgi:chloramphenicol 3-O phosphotransferase
VAAVGDGDTVLSETSPVVREDAPPQCVLLAGPSSAGKSSLARAVQRVASRPWFFFEGDRLSGGFPQGRPEFVTLDWDRRVREGCARAARGLVEAGLDVIVELGLWDPWGRAAAARVLAGLPVYIVRVRCDLATLEDRERRRGDRLLGTAIRQSAELQGVPFDYDVVTDDSTPEVLAKDLLAWLATGPAPVALAKLADSS